jgi:hypothetical protein
LSLVGFDPLFAHQTADESPCGCNAESNSLSGQRVEESGGVADERDATNHAAGDPLLERACSLRRARRRAESRHDAREARQPCVEGSAPGEQYGDSDEVFADRRDVSFRLFVPVHLDEI